MLSLSATAVFPIAAHLRALLCLVAAAALGLAAPKSAPAQSMDTPVEVQLSILLKVITFDRQLRARANPEAVVMVVYQGGNRASVVAKDAAIAILRATPTVMVGVPLRSVAVDLDETTLAEALRADRVTHLYVTPLRAVDVRAVATQARAAGVTTMSGVTRFIESGIALGVGLRGGRPRILVNVEASRLEGAELSAELLKLAEIVK